MYTFFHTVYAKKTIHSETVIGLVQYAFIYLLQQEHQNFQNSRSYLILFPFILYPIQPHPNLTLHHRQIIVEYDLRFYQKQLTISVYTGMEFQSIFDGRISTFCTIRIDVSCFFYNIISCTYIIQLSLLSLINARKYINIKQSPICRDYTSIKLKKIAKNIFYPL